MTDIKEVLDAAEACEFLNIKKSTLYKLTHRRQIPYYRPTGGKIYFWRQDLLDWALSNYVAPKHELDGRASRIVKELPN